MKEKLKYQEQHTKGDDSSELFYKWLTMLFSIVLEPAGDKNANVAADDDVGEKRRWNQP